jgi:hypothetical protein
MSNSGNKLCRKRYLLKANTFSRRRNGMNNRALTLSNRIEHTGIRAPAYWLKPYLKTVKGKCWSFRFFKKPAKKDVFYGRRFALIISTRFDRHYRKYGPIGG